MLPTAEWRGLSTTRITVFTVLRLQGTTAASSREDLIFEGINYCGTDPHQCSRLAIIEVDTGSVFNASRELCCANCTWFDHNCVRSGVLLLPGYATGGGDLVLHYLKSPPYTWAIFDTRGNVLSSGVTFGYVSELHAVGLGVVVLLFSGGSKNYTWSVYQVGTDGSMRFVRNDTSIDVSRVYVWVTNPLVLYLGFDTPPALQVITAYDWVTGKKVWSKTAAADSFLTGAVRLSANASCASQYVSVKPETSDTMLVFIRADCSDYQSYVAAGRYRISTATLLSRSPVIGPSHILFLMQTLQKLPVATAYPYGLDLLSFTTLSYQLAPFKSGNYSSPGAKIEYVQTWTPDGDYLQERFNFFAGYPGSAV